MCYSQGLSASSFATNAQGQNNIFLAASREDHFPNYSPSIPLDLQNEILIPREIASPVLVFDSKKESWLYDCRIGWWLQGLIEKVTESGYGVVEMEILNSNS